VKVRGGKGTLTDRGTHVPLIVRWPGHVQAGSTCTDLVDFSDFLPTLCDLAQAPLPAEAIHGRSFAPQLLGKPGHPREWIHIQHQDQRQVRNGEYLLDHKGRLRKVVALGGKPDKTPDPEKEAAARQSLQAVFDSLGD
jgi:arylsulfatase A